MASTLTALSAFDRLRDFSDTSRRVIEQLAASVRHRLPGREAVNTGAALRQLPALTPLASAEERALAEAVVERLLLEVPEARVVAVLDAATSLPVALAAPADEDELSPGGLAVQFDRIASRIDLMAQAVAGAGEAVEEIIIPTSSLLHITRVVAQGRWRLYVAAPTHQFNMALVSRIMAEIAPLLASIPLPSQP